MGLKEIFSPKKEGGGESKQAKPQKPEGKYNEPCAMCGAAGTEKKWMGQYWHKKCLRSTKKVAKGMV